MCIRQKTTVIVLRIRQKDKNMNREYLRSTISDREENYLNNPLVVRSYSLENEVNHCFFGIRKTGKSYMMFQKSKIYAKAESR